MAFRDPAPSLDGPLGMKFYAVYNFGSYLTRSRVGAPSFGINFSAVIYFGSFFLPSSDDWVSLKLYLESCFLTILLT